MPGPLDLNLPTDENLERDILGSCFSEDRTALANVRAVLDVSEFSFEDNRRIYQSLCRLADAGEPLTWTSVYADMRARSQPITLGQLSDLQNYAWTLDKLLRRAKELARRRALIVNLHEAAHGAADLTAPLADVVQRASTATREAAGDVDQGDDEGDAEAIVMESGGPTQFMQPRVGIPSPWEELDYSTGGWQNGDLILLAARPSVGKTAFALNAAYHAAAKGRQVAIYSYEMDRASLLKRLVSMLARITFVDIQRGDLNASERRSVAEALAHLQELPIRMFYVPGKTALAIRCHAERLKAKGKLDFAMLDFIGMVRGFNDRQMNRNQELGEICRQLKEVASELQIPFLVLSQLSRAVETRTDKRPVMSDLRESGDLEAVADLIGFLYRQGYYSREDVSLRNSAELILGKHRNGDTPTIPLHFEREYGRFSSPGASKAAAA